METSTLQQPRPDSQLGHGPARRASSRVSSSSSASGAAAEAQITARKKALYVKQLERRLEIKRQHDELKRQTLQGLWRLERELRRLDDEISIQRGLQQITEVSCSSSVSRAAAEARLTAYMKALTVKQLEKRLEIENQEAELKRQEDEMKRQIELQIAKDEAEQAALEAQWRQQMNDRRNAGRRDDFMKAEREGQRTVMTRLPQPLLSPHRPLQASPVPSSPQISRPSWIDELPKDKIPASESVQKLKVTDSQKVTTRWISIATAQVLGISFDNQLPAGPDLLSSEKELASNKNLKEVTQESCSKEGRLRKVNPGETAEAAKSLQHPSARKPSEDPEIQVISDSDAAAQVLGASCNNRPLAESDMRKGALGAVWDEERDSPSAQFRDSKKQTTRRGALRRTAVIFDPVRIAAPYRITVQILKEKLWMLRHIRSRWKKEKNPKTWHIERTLVPAGH
ncbi:uncharacterized protein LOC122383387 [Amphibalanus amphitrite]|uniref:uncharacterized protein LOC122383387 n=1 Tax=Amphibalanus amphitrite TaxID=1232801 RepID=UPI001C910CD3|nr:uncharacterized protein LOC122383387 [Amphibalanus amphitrite]